MRPWAIVELGHQPAQRAFEHAADLIEPVSRVGHDSGLRFRRVHEDVTSSLTLVVWRPWMDFIDRIDEGSNVATVTLRLWITSGKGIISDAHLRDQTLTATRPPG